MGVVQRQSRHGSLTSYAAVRAGYQSDAGWSRFVTLALIIRLGVSFFLQLSTPITCLPCGKRLRKVFHLQVPHDVAAGGKVEGSVAMTRQAENVRLVSARGGGVA